MAARFEQGDGEGFRAESVEHERELIRGGLSPLTAGDCALLVHDNLSSNRDLLITRFFNVTPYKYEHVWMPEVHREARKDSRPLLLGEADDEQAEEPWWRMTSFGVATQLYWTQRGGPVFNIMHKLPELKKVVSDTTVDYYVSDAPGEEGLRLPACTTSELESLLKRIFRKECESIRRAEALQHVGSAKLHTVVYKAGKVKRRLSPTKRQGKQKVALFTRLAMQGRLFLIQPEFEEAWKQTVGDKKKQQRIQECLAKDGHLSIWFDDLVPPDVRKDTAQGLKEGSDYDVQDLSYVKLRELMVLDGLDSETKLAFRHTEKGSNALELIDSNEKFSEAIRVLQDRMLRTQNDDYMLFVTDEIPQVI